MIHLQRQSTLCSYSYFYVKLLKEQETSFNHLSPYNFPPKQSLVLTITEMKLVSHRFQGERLESNTKAFGVIRNKARAGETRCQLTCQADSGSCFVTKWHCPILNHMGNGSCLTDTVISSNIIKIL